MDFLSLLNESNSITNQSTNEITLNIPIFPESNEKYVISNPCKITSNCNTIIKSDNLKIVSSKVSFSNLTFESSLEISDSVNISITNCTIKTPNTRFGFLISHGQQILLDNVEISGSSEFGLYISDDSDVKINGLTVHDLSKSLVIVRRNSKVKMTKSKLYNSSCNCMNSDNDCDIEISESLFDNSGMSSLYLCYSKCKIVNCEFQNTQQTLLVIENSPDFLVEKNFFSNAEIAAICVEKSKGIIKDNKIIKMEGNGVNVIEKCDVQILNNDFYDLKYPAITVKKKSSALVSGNKIEKDEINGISIRDTLNVTIQNNEIKDVLNCGISVSDCPDKISILNNKISDCKVTAIESYNKSSLYIYNNKISNIEKYAFLAYTSGYLNVVENEINDVKIAMVKLAFKGAGEFFNNKIENCTKQCECQTSSIYFFNKNGQFEGVTNDKERANESIKFEEKLNDTNISKLCLKCKSKPHNCFLLECGHNVYCKECAELALNNKELCPLCRWNIDKISPGFNTSEDNKCIIYFENEPNSIVLPCGHLGICSECLENWFNDKKVCPICRTDSCFYKIISNNVI